MSVLAGQVCAVTSPTAYAYRLGFDTGSMRCVRGDVMLVLHASSLNLQHNIPNFCDVWCVVLVRGMLYEIICDNIAPIDRNVPAD